MRFVDYENAEKPDGFGAIVMNEKLTIPETQAYRRGFNAGHRNRRLAMDLPRDKETRQLAGVEFFGCEAYGTGYFNGWREADELVLRGVMEYEPCAAKRGHEFDRRRRAMLAAVAQ